MKLIEAAKKFLEIDDRIHSQPGEVSSAEIISDAECYTRARRELMLAIQAASQQHSADNDGLCRECGSETGLVGTEHPICDDCAMCYCYR